MYTCRIHDCSGPESECPRCHPPIRITPHFGCEQFGDETAAQIPVPPTRFVGGAILRDHIASLESQLAAMTAERDRALADLARCEVALRTIHATLSAIPWDVNLTDLEAHVRRTCETIAVALKGTMP